MAFETAKPACTKIENRAGCIQAALEILGDKWTPLLLSQLVEKPMTFGEIDLSLSGISPRTLSARLSRLEAEKIINKKEYNAHPPRYKYQLTSKGLELQDVLKQMAAWGERYAGASNE